jgi:D-alanine-D-alanine ligase
LARAPKVIVKSITEHASIGIEQSSVMSGRRAVQFIADRMAQTGDPHFAEAFVDGREFALSLLETDDDLRVLPPAETLFVGYGDDVHHIVDYDAKWVEDSHGYQNTPRRFDFPEADDALLEELQRLARACWDLFGLSGYARIDFRVDDTGQPWILEVNTNPCLAPDAGFMAAAAEAGLTFEAVIAKIVSAGLRTTKKAA